MKINCEKLYIVITCHECMQIYQTYLTHDPVVNENINLYLLKKYFSRTLFYIAGY